MKICPACKKENGDIAKFCRFCGEDLGPQQTGWQTDFDATSIVEDDLGNNTENITELIHGNEPEDGTQLIFGGDSGDPFENDEAKRREILAEKERRARKRRRKQPKTPQSGGEDPYVDGIIGVPSGDGATGWETLETEPTRKRTNILSVILWSLLGIAAVGALILGILFLPKYLRKKDNGGGNTQASTFATTQTEVSETEDTEATSETGYTSATTETEYTEAASETEAAQEEPITSDIMYSQQDYDSGNYTTVITLKSLDLNGVSLYSEPDGLSYDTIPEAVTCALIDRKSVGGVTWDYVSFCGKTGWVKEQYIRNTAGGVEYFYVGNNYGDTAFVTKSKIKIHSKPESTAGTVTAENIPYGTEFVIDELRNGWGHSYYNGEECWVDMNVMGFYSSLTWQIERGDGKTGGINLREKPSEDSKKLDKIPVRTRINEVEHRDGWAKVNYGGKAGWVKLHYATPCGDTALSFSEG